MNRAARNASTLPSPASADNLQLLLATLPAGLQEATRQTDERDLLEIVMDLGRPPQARYPDRAVTLSDRPVTHEDLAHVVALVGEFGADNRAGIEGTLHRISALRNRHGRIVGLTLRIGRAVSGTIDLIRDLVESGASLLLLGRPGIGKTTKLREIARVLADDLGKRVIVIDTSNEIAGDGDIPHPAIGGARRMQVSHPERQHAVMIEAVENHMPEVIVVDEIGTAAEAMAARTIAERGVQLIGTAHGNTLENLVMNPTLSDLIGGVQTVTLSDEEARLRGTQKTINERKAAPTFGAVVEIVDRHAVIVHRDTGAAVDRLLRGIDPGAERRVEGGGSSAVAPTKAADTQGEPQSRVPLRGGARRIYAHALSRDSVDRMVRDMRLPARTVARAEQADLVLSLRARAQDQRLERVLAATGAELHAVKSNTTAQIRHTLQSIFHVIPGAEDVDVQAAVREAEDAVQRVLAEGVSVALSPCSPALRKLQHRIASRNQLLAESAGSGALRHLVIHPA